MDKKKLIVNYFVNVIIVFVASFSINIFVFSIEKPKAITQSVCLAVLVPMGITLGYITAVSKKKKNK